MKNQYFKAVTAAMLAVCAAFSVTSCNIDSLPAAAGVTETSVSEIQISLQSSETIETELNKKQTSDSNAESFSEETESAIKTESSEETQSGNPAPESNTSAGSESSNYEESSSTESQVQPDPVEQQRAQMAAELDEKKLKVAKRLYDIMLSKKLTKTSAEIKTELISQYPELPTGCEAMALTMALNSVGFGLEKTDITDYYMPYGYSFVTSYVGDPTTYDGAGIYPPGLTYCANNVISKRTNKYYALDTTGTSLSDLYKLIENGCPVVVWSTLYLYDPLFTGDYETYEGHEYAWYTNEHCIVLYGYDRKKNTVRVCDSRAGDIEYNADWFESIHNATGRMSLSIIVM